MNMNNEQKNIYVKKQITAALLALLKEKSLSDISVSELTSKAEIGRVSFYRNYQSKEDILKEESDRLIQEWGKMYESNPDSAPETFFPSFGKGRLFAILTLFFEPICFAVLGFGSAEYRERKA